MSERDEPVESVVSLKLDHLQTTMDEVKKDVKEIKDESPVLRIRQLEDRYQNLDDKIEAKYKYLDNRWGRLVWFLALVGIALLGAYATAWFTR